MRNSSSHSNSNSMSGSFQQHQQQEMNNMNSNNNNNSNNMMMNPIDQENNGGDPNFDPTQVDGFFREDGAFVQVMPDGMQFIYLPDGQMGYLLPDGTFHQMTNDDLGELGVLGGEGEENINNNSLGLVGEDQSNNNQQQQQQQLYYQNNNNNNNNNNTSSGTSGQITPEHQYQQQHQHQHQQNSNLPSPDNLVAQNIFPQQQSSNHQPQNTFSNNLPSQDSQLQQNNTNNNNNNNNQLPPAPGLEPLFEAENTTNFGYWPNLIIEIFVSTFFKLYLCILMWNCSVILFFSGINWMFGALSRVYHPPVEADSDWQSMGWIGIFVAVSFFVATFMTMLVGLTKEAWRVEKHNTTFWGFSFQFWKTSLDFGCFNKNNNENRNGNNQNSRHNKKPSCCSQVGECLKAWAACCCCGLCSGCLESKNNNNNNTSMQHQQHNQSNQEEDEEMNQEQDQFEIDERPPYHIYGILIVLLIVAPFFTALGVSVANGENGMYFASYFSYVVHIIMLIVLAVMYVWMYLRSVQAKWQAWQTHTIDPMDDEDESDPKVHQRRRKEEEEELEMENARKMHLHLTQQAHQQQNNNDTSSTSISNQHQHSTTPSPLRMIQHQQQHQQQLQGQIHHNNNHDNNMNNQLQLQTTLSADRPFRRWYRSPALLFEFGLDKRSTQWTVFVFIFGFTGVLIVATILATQETHPTLAAAWIVAVVFFVVILAIMWFASRRGKRISIYTNLFLLLLFFILVMVGCGAGPYSGTFALFLVPFLLTQGGLLRKQEYTLRKHEIEALYGGSVEEIKPTFDTYIITGRKFLTAVLSYYFDVKKIFGARHPQVKFADRQYRTERVNLYTDIRVLFHLWLVFWFMLCAISSFTTTLPWPAISVSQSTAPAGTTPSMIEMLTKGETLQATSFPFCKFSTGNNETFSAYDLSLMALLAESAGAAFDADFEAYFRSNADSSKFNRTIEILPNADVVAQPPAANARYPSFIDFYDPDTKSHAIVLRAAANRGGTLLRNLDMMGDSAAFQLAAIFAPTMNSWPINEKRRFVAGIADVKLVASNSNVTGDVESYLRGQIFTKEGHTAVIVGFGFNGAIAVIAGALTGAPVVTFNSPGTSLIAEKYRINDDMAQNSRRHALHVRTRRSLVGLLGESDDLGATHILACSDNDEFNCDSIAGIARLVGNLCGDEKYSRVVWPK